MDSEGRPGILQFAFMSGLASIFVSIPAALILDSGLAASVVNGIIVAAMIGLAMGLVWRCVIDPVLSKNSIARPKTGCERPEWRAKPVCVRRATLTACSDYLVFAGRSRAALTPLGDNSSEAAHRGVLGMQPSHPWRRSLLVGR